MEGVPELEGWHDFYVVVGSGAAALTGLLFVIVSLGPRRVWLPILDEKVDHSRRHCLCTMPVVCEWLLTLRCEAPPAG